MAIDSFTGDYHFLSNFAASKVELDGVEYKSVEHGYQAAKTLNPEGRRRIREAPTPGAAKKLGRSVYLRPDWEEIKFDVMENLLRQKFNQPDFRRALLNTSNIELIEGNTWGDTIWGVCKGKGENHLGKILMKIRKDLQK